MRVDPPARVREIGPPWHSAPLLLAPQGCPTQATSATVRSGLMRVSSMLEPELLGTGLDLMLTSGATGRSLLPFKEPQGTKPE